VTFALFAYNHEHYIREAVDGAFSQTYEPLEIILSDDCSSDRTFEIMQEMAAAYEGPHEVQVRRNEVNLGIGAHVSHVLGNAKGDYFCLAAGDDISEYDRVDRGITAIQLVKRSFEGNLNVSCISSLTLIDERGSYLGTERHPKGGRPSKNKYGEDICILGIENLLDGTLRRIGASRIIPKRLYEIFGDISRDCSTEDIIYHFRSAIAGKVVHLSVPTVRYRKHQGSISSAGQHYAKPFDGVIQQLENDLKLAEQAGILDASDVLRAKRWLREEIAFRRFERSKADKSKTSARDLATIIFAKQLRARRKFGILREFFGLR
jgi:hypothetical protein